MGIYINTQIDNFNKYKIIKNTLSAFSFKPLNNDPTTYYRNTKDGHKDIIRYLSEDLFCLQLRDVSFYYITRMELLNKLKSIRKMAK